MGAGMAVETITDDGAVETEGMGTVQAQLVGAPREGMEDNTGAGASLHYVVMGGGGLSVL